MALLIACVAVEARRPVPMVLRGVFRSARFSGANLLTLLLGGLSRSARRLAERMGPRLPLVAGPILAAAGFLLLGMRAGDARYWTGVLPGMLALAGGLTLAVAPLTAAVPDGQAGVASGINNAVARVAGLLAACVLGNLTSDAGNAAGFRHVAYAGVACAAAAAATAAGTIGPRAPA